MHVSIVPRTALSRQDREAMLALHRGCFDQVERIRFMRDLDSKDSVILLRQPDGRLAGFSTVRCFSLVCDGTPTRILFSGDTVVARMHRRTGLLGGAFGHLMLDTLARHPDVPCYWFLISKGYRTYRYLPLYFRRYIPGFGQPDSPALTRIRNAAAAHLFGSACDHGGGIVRHAGIGDRLNPTEAAIPPGRAADPHVRFFVDRNPRYAQGDELACLAPVSRENLTPAAIRLIARTQLRAPEGTP